MVNDKESFIDQAKIVHGDKYDYSEVIYEKSIIKVSIICRLHGHFSQTPCDHLRGRGCPECKKVTLRKLRSDCKETFVTKAIARHGNYYDYSKVVYEKSTEKILIICPLHGEFYQKPNEHVQGKGCSKCGQIKRAKSQSLSTQEFINRSKEVHGEKFDFSQTNYQNMSTKVDLICPKHGTFSQSPINHLAGNGCPKCNASKGEMLVETFLTKHGIKYERQYRISTCKNKRPLPFDFAVWSEDGVLFLIEFNGEHHYRPAGFGKDAFEKTRVNDCIKEEWCKLHSIPLLVIKYDESEVEMHILSFLGKI